MVFLVGAFLGGKCPTIAVTSFFLTPTEMDTFLFSLF